MDLEQRKKIMKFVSETNLNTISDSKQIKNQEIIKYNEFLSPEDLDFLKEINNNYESKKYYNKICRKLFGEKIKVKVIYKCDKCGKTEEKEIKSVKGFYDFLYRKPEIWWVFQCIPYRDINDIILYEFDYNKPKEWEIYNCGWLYCKNCLEKIGEQEIKEVKNNMLKERFSFLWYYFFNIEERKEIQKQFNNIYKNYSGIEIENNKELYIKRCYYETQYIDNDDYKSNIREEIFDFEKKMFNKDINRREQIFYIMIQDAIRGKQIIY